MCENVTRLTLEKEREGWTNWKYRVSFHDMTNRNHNKRHQIRIALSCIERS